MEVIESAAPERREQLAEIVKAYSNDCFEDYEWATSTQAPVLLRRLIEELSPPADAIGTYDLIDAVRDVIASANPEECERLTRIVKACTISEAQAPALLRRVMLELSSPEVVTVIHAYDLLDAIKEMIASAEPEKREQLAETFDAFAEDNPEDYERAVGAQAPVLLHHLMMELSPPYGPKTTSVAGDADLLF